MSDPKNQTTSFSSVSNSSKVADHDARDGLHQLQEDVSMVRTIPETANICEHKLKARKQFTHLPVDCQAAFDARHSDEDVPKCDECAILEDIVANKCEKCLFAQELVSQQPSRKSSEPKNLPESYSRRRSPSLKKRRAPPVPSALPLPRTKTEAELLVCSPAIAINPQKNEQKEKLAGEKTDEQNTANRNTSLSAVIARCSSIEVFKRGKKKSQFAASNVYVIQPTFKQIVRPLTYQTSKGIQCDRLKKTSPMSSRSTSHREKKDDSEEVMKKYECFEDSDIELDSESNPKFSDIESSSYQEEGKKFNVRKKSKSKNQTNERKRSVLIQCRIPRKHSRSKLPVRSKSEARSKSASPTKTRPSHQYDVKKSSLSDICIGSSESESLENSKDYSSTLSTKPSTSAGSDTKIVIEEKIYVKCPTDSICKKKITTGNKSILSGKSLASDFRSLLCDKKLFDTRVPPSNDQLIEEKTKSSSNKRSTPSDKKFSSPDKKFTAKKSPSPDKETIRSSRNSVSPDRRSHMSHLKSEHSDSGSGQSDNRSDHFDEKPSNIKCFDQSLVSDEKCVFFDEKSIASHKDINGFTKSFSSYENETPGQSESDFCAALWKTTDRLHHDQSNTSDEKCVCFDEKSIKRINDVTKSYSSYGSEASGYSENDFCAAFRKKNNSFNNKYTEDRATEETDSEYDYHSCSEVDSNLLQAHHSTLAARDSKIGKKQNKSLSEEIDVEAYKEMIKTASRGQSHSNSHTTVLFKIIDMSQISCVFITLIILIIMFFVAMLAWRIVKDRKSI